LSYVGFSIEGQSQAKINCHDNEDGSADVSYFPTIPGEYVVHVLCADEDITNSPFVVHVVSDAGHCDPTKVFILFDLFYLNYCYFKN